MTTANAINANTAGLVRYNGTGTFDGVTTTNHNILIGATSNGITNLALTNGQLAIGSTGADPVAATLTAGTGVGIVNGAGTITVNAVGGGITWSETSGSFSAASNHGYFLTGASTPTMPASPSEGDVISFICDTSSTVTITGNTGQTLRVGSTVSASAGTCASSTQGNAVTFVYKSTGTVWIAQNVVGTWTIT